MATSTTSSRKRKLGVALWILQGLLAATFLCTGGMKLLLPADLLAESTPLPILFVRFIGLCEFLGALGLILPGLLRIRPGLTPLAAAGLVPIMIGATLLTPTLMGADVLLALIPLTFGVLAGLVAYGRARLAPQQPRSSQSVLALAG
ncbi:MAG: DoxX family protein [Chloroflexi bacterium]|nr:DoxX family protein [Chloroflexota bacterium]